MEFLSKDLENIIINYKEEMENLEIHRIKFKKSIDLIKMLKYNCFRYGPNNRERTITIYGYKYSYCLRVCLICNNIIQTSHLDNCEIGNSCKHSS